MCYNIIVNKTKTQGVWAMKIIPQTDEQYNDLSQRLSGFCKEFKIYTLLRRFGAEKVRGFSFQAVFDFVFALVFSGRNLYNTMHVGINILFSKDTVYRFLNSAKIHWEKVLLLLALSVIERIRALTGEKRLTAIVIDDSPFSRNRSKKVELLAKVFDHVKHTYFMGFRMLTLGFTDGNTFIPFAQQLM